MDHHEAFDAVRLVFHSDIPDALLRRVIEEAIQNHRDETESQKDEAESRRKFASAGGSGADAGARPARTS